MIAKKKLFSRGIVTIYKDHGTTIDDILRWLKLTLYFEDQKNEMKGKMLRLEPMPRYAELFQTGICTVGFGLHASQVAAVRKFGNYQWNVSAILGRQTVDSYSESPLIKQHEYRHITADMVREGLRQFVGQIEQNNPNPLYSEWMLRQKQFKELDEDNLDEVYGSHSFKISIPRVRFCDSIELVEMDDSLLRLKISSDGLFNCRSLIRDLGQQLGCYASIDQLHLSSIGPITAQNSLQKHEIHFEQVVDFIEKNTAEIHKYFNEIQKCNPETSTGRRFI